VKPGTSRTIVWAVALTAAGVLGLVGVRAMANRTEEPEFTVVASRPGLELRQYAATVVAETVVEAELDKAGNEGFRRLAGYIFGGNHGPRARKIAMTAPVALEPARAGERIAMTTPVAQERVGAGEGDLVGAGRYCIRFTMPRGSRLDTLPIPDDERVVLREEPGRLVAAHRYSGRWNDRAVVEHSRTLLAALDRAGLRPLGPPVYARYDPPWTLPWLRRNEILVPVERAGN
jgi:hypothetical protein